ncbi:MAG TPA: hypothetical protein PKJ77_03815 [Thermodesulfobacteriota bacterium]|nr:hypothetical protein [Deltaproteobacteria bacterium]HNR11848.1 hypothetical protein [Thermodesulfobacteriota bacterium]HNU70097.1 hypothetical protein [Thermodesulfobacteriota bacterium]HOC38382.1 hypothetical protein [Thermodesulfobacteriota bacterium]
MQTLPKDISGYVLGAVYDAWRDISTNEDMSENTPQGLTLHSVHIIASPTTAYANQGRLEAIAGQWEITADGVLTKPKYNNRSTTPKKAFHSPQLNKDVVEYAIQNSIPIADIGMYYDLLYRNLSGTQEVEVSLVSDYEIENYCLIGFAVKAKSSIEDLLENEEKFKKVARKLVSRESRAHFVLTLEVV